MTRATRRRSSQPLAPKLPLPPQAQTFPTLVKGSSPAQGGEQPRRATHASGPYVVWASGYFFLSDHPDQTYLGIHMYCRWGRDDQVGNDQVSMQLAPPQFGEARNDPRRTKVLLRTWALWRMRQSGVWLVAHTRRHRQLARGEAELERDVRALPGPITGDPAVDGTLRDGALEVVGRL